MIAVERLLASAIGELTGRADEEVEEHVLSCSLCAERYAWFVRIGPAIAELVRGGAATMPITWTLAERLEAEGLISRRYDLRPDSVVPCAVGAADIYSLITFHVDLTGTSRVDLIRGGQRIADIPFDAAVGRVHFLSSAEALRALPTMKLELCLIAVDPTGERALGECILDHTGYLPGS